MLYLDSSQNRKIYIVALKLILKMTQKEIMKEMRNMVYFGSMNLLKGFYDTAIELPYLFPTAKRKSSGTDGGAELIGRIAGLFADIGQIVGYGYLATHDNAELLAIPAATNAISALYEKSRSKVLYRNERKEARNKSLEQMTIKPKISN